MTAYLVIAVVGAGSYALRVSMLARQNVPPLMQRAAPYATPVAFAALATSALAPDATYARTAIAPLLAVAVAVLAVRRTGSPRAALVAGMPALWLASALVH
jgi:branched-subunit amino acid transport protein